MSSGSDLSRSHWRNLTGLLLPLGLLPALLVFDLSGSRPQGTRRQAKGLPDEKWEKLAYHVRRAWRRAHVVQHGAALIPELVESVRELIPVVHRINRGQ